MCTSEPFLAECENVEASMKKKKPRENYEQQPVIKDSYRGEARTEGSGRVRQIHMQDIPVRRRDIHLLYGYWVCLATEASESETDDYLT